MYLIDCQQQMEARVVEEYACEIMNWITLADSPTQISHYLEIFLERVEKAQIVHVSFDDRFATSILLLLDTLKLQSFDTDHPNIKRELLKQVGRELYSCSCIERIHMHQIIQKANEPFRKKLQEFIWIATMLQPCSPLKIRQIWKKITGFQIVDFWAWAGEQKISHSILLELYEITLRMGDRLSSRVLASPHFQNVQKEYENWIQKEQSMWLSQTNTLSSSNISSDASTINDLLRQTAHKGSLFLNSKNAAALHAINAFIKEFSSVLFPHKQAYFQYYGSLRSRMALIGSFDIDLTVICIQERAIDYNYPIEYNNNHHLRCLMELIQQQRFSWLAQCYLSMITNPFAYLKLTVDPAAFYHSCKVPNVTKIDITMDNRHSIVNSQFISKFAENQEVLAFCVLVKMWAKNVNLINASHPMHGLSAYGLVLMSLYYLMSTTQIDFLQNPTDVSVKNCDIYSLYHNFTGFLKFYSSEGDFRKQRKVVCLMNHPHSHLYNQELIINIHDHLDNQNPGRLTIDYIRKFDAEFDRAIIIMESNNTGRIGQLFGRIPLDVGQ